VSAGLLAAGLAAGAFLLGWGLRGVIGHFVDREF
jgi:hypothetical protein